MPSRAYTSLLLTNKSALDALDICVNALSGLYLIVTFDQDCDYKGIDFRCQCPLGLIPHCYNDYEEIDLRANRTVSMPSRAYTSLLLIYFFLGNCDTNLVCQCPLGLIPHCYDEDPLQI